MRNAVDGAKIKQKEVFMGLTANDVRKLTGDSLSNVIRARNDVLKSCDIVFHRQVKPRIGRGGGRR